MTFLANNYNRKKISFKKGIGSYLVATNGKKYLDFVQGIAVNSLGHAHPKLIKVINKQSKNQALLTDVASQNASKQFNATSQNQSFAIERLPFARRCLALALQPAGPPLLGRCRRVIAACRTPVRSAGDWCEALVSISKSRWLLRSDSG